MTEYPKTTQDRSAWVLLSHPTAEGAASGALGCATLGMTNTRKMFWALCSLSLYLFFHLAQAPHRTNFKVGVRLLSFWYNLKRFGKAFKSKCFL